MTVPALQPNSGDNHILLLKLNRHPQWLLSPQASSLNISGSEPGKFRVADVREIQSNIEIRLERSKKNNLPPHRC